ILLSHAFFERSFGADASIVGKPVAVNGRQVVVAGVLPRSFGAELPPSVGSQLPAGPLDGYHATVVQPLAPNSQQIRLFSVLARLKAGVSIERATSELAA